MNKIRNLNIQGTMLDKEQLKTFLEKIATEQNVEEKSNKETFPEKNIKSNYLYIRETYKLLNEHLRLKISIHPAGEWILDNFYIIEEISKGLLKELTLKKYINLPGIINGKYKGFSRIYVLASQIIAYTEGKINKEDLEEYLQSYQRKSKLSMEEIWSLEIFLKIALINKIKEICERIYSSQMQKYKVEIILDSTIEKTINKIKTNNISIKKILEKEIKNKNLPKYLGELTKNIQTKYSFVEYMLYRLKKYGKQSYQYICVLEDSVNKTGNDITEIIRKEHYEIALKKVEMGNCIVTLKNLSRINFSEIFEKINGVENILKEDPAEIYEKMDRETKEYYRGVIQEISKKTKLSEIYVTQRLILLCKENQQKVENINKSEIKEYEKKIHVGYYLISDGKKEFIAQLLNKNKYLNNENNIYNLKIKKQKKFVYGMILLNIIISLIISCAFFYKIKNVNENIFENILLSIIVFIMLIIPIQNIFTKIIQYISSKIIKPTIIPKLDIKNGIPKESCTMVVIPTILKNSQQIKELTKRLEISYMANKSENIYFTLLGDCSLSNKQKEKFDDEIVEAGIKEINNLNEKYKDQFFNKFNFIYRKRTWNNKEEAYLGWERKRGLLNQFNEYLLGNKEVDAYFIANTIKNKEEEIPKIKYIITIDSDTELVLNSAIKLVGAMSHILNKPILNKEKDLVISGHGIIAPMVATSLEEKSKNEFIDLFGSDAGTDAYTNIISDFYQDNFDEGIYCGKGIYELQTFNTVLNNEIKENTVLSHDLLEGSYLRCGYASDILILDGCPSNYLSYKQRLSRWIRGDIQIIRWLQPRIENKKQEIKKNPLNILSKYKIISNVLRSKNESACIILLIFISIMFIKFNINLYILFTTAILTIISPVVIEIIDNIIVKIKRNKNNKKTRTFNKNSSGIKKTLKISIINLMLIPDKAYLAEVAKIKTLYRMKKERHLLEWITSQEVEQNTKNNISAYYKSMFVNVYIGMIGIIIFLIYIVTNTNLNEKIIITSIFNISICLLWIIAPIVMYKISNNRNKTIIKYKELCKENQEYLKEIGLKTWKFFKDFLTKENNYLPPDNYQEDRIPQIIKRTSPTNIGLAILSVISSYDLKYENIEDTINLLSKMLEKINMLEKWNGHLYNWYNLETLKVLENNKYISTVDSGNFVGYLYVLKEFLNNIKDNNKEIQENINVKITEMLEKVEKIINTTDFSKLYDEKIRII